MQLSLLIAPLLLLVLAGPLSAQTTPRADPQPIDPANTPAPASQPSAATPDPAVPPVAIYQPLRGAERAQWYLRNTGGAAIGGSVLSAGWATAWGTPREYPATWEGFGKRYALSISGVAIANGAEVSLGALWGEDPRYIRKGGNLSNDFGPRLNHVLLSTVTATNRRGERMPAYARFIAIPGSSVLQNQWRPESQSSANEALLRTLYGFLGRMSANAIREFLPDLRRRRVSSNAPDPTPPPAPASTAP